MAHSIPFDRGALRSTSLSIRRYRGTDYPIALTTRFNAWFLVQWLHRCLPGDLLRYSKCNFIYYYNSSLFPSRGFVVPPWHSKWTSISQPQCILVYNIPEPTLYMLSTSCSVYFPSDYSGSAAGPATCVASPAAPGHALGSIYFARTSSRQSLAYVFI